MCIYAVDFVVIRQKEKYWENQTEDNILEKVLSIVRKYHKDCSLNDKKEFIKTILKLKEYHMEFKIACYREGVKKRLNEIIAVFKYE